jgi:hypothetical protein
MDALPYNSNIGNLVKGQYYMDNLPEVAGASECVRAANNPTFAQIAGYVSSSTFLSFAFATIAGLFAYAF